jgi:adenine-specific DNA-methyltransferase
MDEVNAAISANADNEELVDQPYEERRFVRVAGPFSMESVIALEEGPDTPIGGAPEPDAATFDGSVAAVNADAHLDKIIRLLRASGVDFKNNVRVLISALESVTGVDFLHAQGTWMPDGKTERRVAVSIGPEVGNLSRFQAKAAFKAANRRGFDDLVFAANGFDATAQDAIEEDSGDELRLHMSLIRPDVGMDDLLKTQPGSQIFTVFTAPRASQARTPEGEVIVTMEGMDVYDPVTNTLQPTPASGLGAWFVDGDYDGRTFCITQAFFPDKSRWDKLAKALGNTGVIDEGAFDALSGTTSLPIPRPGTKKKTDPWRIAVKVIDPRGNEGMRVLTIDHG